MEHVEEL